MIVLIQNDFKLLLLLTNSKMQADEVFLYSWWLDDTGESISIRVYGIDKNNNNTCIIVDDFEPYVYLELPSKIKWTETRAKMLFLKLKETVGSTAPIRYKLEYKKKLFGANIDDNDEYILYPYLKCFFKSRTHIKNLSYKLRYPLQVSELGKITLKMHEQDADPILQFVCQRDIPTSGWVKFTGYKIKEDDKISRCVNEFNVKTANITSVEKDILAQPLILAFDIEVNSSNPNVFTDVRKPDDKIFQISCILYREGDKEYNKILMTIFEPDMNKLSDDIEVQLFSSEADLLEGFTELIQEYNPNVIAGYNIFGYDIPYMIGRSKMLRCISKFDMQGFHKFNHAKERKIKWSSSAYKDQEFDFLDAEGRLYVDLLPIVRRDFKMDNYKLKTISSYFLGDTKDDLNAHGIFKCYRLGVKANCPNATEKECIVGKQAISIVGNYCVKDSVLVMDLILKLQTWTALCEMAKVTNVPPFVLYTQGQQIKVYSQVYKYCMYNNIVVEKDGYLTLENDRYVGAHVFKPMPGLYHKVVPLDFSSLYPSIIIAYNIDPSTWVKDPKIPSHKCHVMEWEDHISCEHDPKVIRQNELDNYIDKQKRAIKLLKETKTENAKAIVLTEKLKPYIKERSEIHKSLSKNPMCQARSFKFLKTHKGVFPSILQNLLDARKRTRNKMKDLKKELEQDKTEQEKKSIKTLLDILDKRQLSYKIACNSAYGIMGVTKGYLPFMPGAMTTTYIGRISIEKVSEYIPSFKGELIYGDTDSQYVTFPHLTDAKDIWAYAQFVAEQISKEFPSPMKLEFEETIYWKFFILTKKRYMYQSCDSNGILNHKVGKKGVLLARRDNSIFIREMYEKVITMLFEQVPKDDVLYFIVSHLNDLCSGRLAHDKFIVTKTVGSYACANPSSIYELTETDKGVKKAKMGNYVAPLLSEDECERQRQLTLKGALTEQEYYNKCLPAQVQLAILMAKRGKPVDVGTRLEYLITKNGSKQYEKIESYDYFKRHSSVIKIDYNYYLKSLIIPLDQMLNIVYGEKNYIKEQYTFRTNYREKLLNTIKGFTKPKIRIIE